MKEFYVYALLDPRKQGVFNYEITQFDFEPFYIGKGNGRRAKRHIDEAKWNRIKVWNRFKDAKIKSILRAGSIPIIIKIKVFTEEHLSFEYEKLLISHIGRHDLKKGPLVNLTDGGEGKCGHIVGDKSKNKVSRTLKQLYANGTMKAWNTGLTNTWSPETKIIMAKKVSLSTRGKKKTLSITQRDNLRNLVRKRFQGGKISEEVKATMAIAQKARRLKEKQLGIIGKSTKGIKRSSPVWNKGLTKITDSRVAKQGWREVDKERMIALVKKTQIGRVKSAEERIHLSEGLKGRKVWNSGMICKCKPYSFYKNGVVITIPDLQRYCTANKLCYNSMVGLSTGRIKSGVYKEYSKL